VPLVGNTWYVAGFADEVTPDVLLARTICGIPMLLYRDPDGALVAIRDTCPHRSAPLSLGVYRDGVVSCRYHGLAFGRGGACVTNPHGPITAALAGKAWPVAERHGFAWVWPGDRNRADAALIPDLSIIDETHPNGKFRAYLPTAANYQLCTDNILDLSHTDYLHPDTLGGGGLTQAKPAVTVDGDTLIMRWENVGEHAPAAFDRELAVQGQLSNTVTQVIWHAPAVMRLFVSVESRVPGGGRISQTTMHIMTPETKMTTHYFVLSTRDFRSQDAEFNARVSAFVTNIFATEDKPMLEAQQERMGTPDLWATHPAILPIDAGAVQARRILERLIAAEEAA
jgi:phenylpropionate dioxygenase-like ring-hydroxylating dioxygenase large terminal subunit